MEEYSNKYYNEHYEKENPNLCVNNNLRKALRILLNFKYLDLTIDPNTAHFGLRFYTLFNRLDAVGGFIPELKHNSFVSLQADITVPAGYRPAFDNTNRSTIIPICDLRAVAFVVERGRTNDLLKELRRNYDDAKIYNIPCSCNKDILDVLVNCQCDAFNNTMVYEIGVEAIDRSNNPIRGKIVAYDSQLIWVQGIDTDVPPTFYIVPLKYISFITV